MVGNILRIKRDRMPDGCKRGCRWSLFVVLMFGLLWAGALTVQAKTKEVFIHKISGNKMTYRNVVGTAPDSHGPVEGGRKKTIKLAGKMKFYWYRNGEIMKYKRISRKVFEKRVKYVYYPWTGRFERDWQTGKLLRNGHQYAKIRISKGKVTKVWAMYRP